MRARWGVPALALAWAAGFFGARALRSEAPPLAQSVQPARSTARCPPGTLPPSAVFEPSEVAPFVLSLADEVVLVDCDGPPCQGGAWLPDEEEAQDLLDTLTARYPGAWVRSWPADDGGMLVSFVVGSGEGETDELSLLKSNDSAVAIRFAGR